MFLYMINNDKLSFEELENYKGWVATVFCVARTHFARPDISAHAHVCAHQFFGGRTSHQHVLFGFRISYSFKEHPILFCFRTSFSVLEHPCDLKNVKKKVEKWQILAILLQKVCKSAILAHDLLCVFFIFLPLFFFSF